MILMLNIVICDDMPIMRDDLDKIIRGYEIENDAQFNICQFENGEELIKKFDEDNTYFDLFFLDYYMKKLTGVETALHIRRYNTKCHIVFVTSSDSRYEFMKASPLQILQKPAKRESVYQILSKVLSGNSCHKI